MGMKKNNPGCGCCGCWSCNTAPETVAVTADTYAGTCCQYPSGTYTVGTVVIGSSDSASFWNEDLNQLIASGNTGYEDYDCDWTWRVIATLGTECTTTPPYQMTGSAGIAQHSYVALCESNDKLDSGSSVVGEYNVVLQARLHVKWANGPSRIIVIVARYYSVIRCDSASGISPDLAGYLYVFDEYKVESVDCAALPSTISHTARHSIWENIEAGTSGSGDVSTLSYGYNPASSSAYDKYTFTACSANASVSLTYV